MRNRVGQILPLGILLILAICLMWITILNVGKLIKDRIQMQIAADTAAQSACALRAGALNSIGRMNSWLGTPVWGIGIPKGAWWTAPLHAPDDRLVKERIGEIRRGLEEIKNILHGRSESTSIDGLLKMLLAGGLMALGTSYDIHPKMQPNMSEYQKRFITGIRDTQTALNRLYGGSLTARKISEIATSQKADALVVPPNSYSLHLRRNHGPVWYLSTLHVWLPKGAVPLPFPPTEDRYMEDAPETPRWYEQGPDFHRQSMRVLVIRYADSPHQGPFPLGQRLLRIRPPRIVTTAAARAFNPRGPMFPSPDQTAGPVGGMAAMHAYHRSRDSWRAQLIPVGDPYAH